MTITLNTRLALPCGVSLPNRIGKAAMTEGLADLNDHATVAHQHLYRAWSKGGAGLLITGNIMVDHRYLERPGNVVVQDRAGFEQLQRWALAATENGNQCWAQISHPGRQCARISSGQPLSPSDVQLHLVGSFAKPKPMTESDIEEAINRYVNTAVIMRDAGFTGAQIHGAHGYLISQFLSPLTNRRTDQWGGSLENRARFLLQIVRKVRLAVGDAYPISVKLNSADFQKGGFSLEDSAQVAKWLSDENIDLLEISGGTYEQTRLLGYSGDKNTAQDPATDSNVRQSTRTREAYFLEYAQSIQQVIDIPLMVTGGFRSRQTMTDALAMRELHVIGLARPLCAHPELPRQLLDGSVEQAPDDRIKMGAGKFGPASDLSLFRVMNVQGEVAWHYDQIIRLSQQRPTLSGWGVFRSFFTHVLREYNFGLRRKWAQRNRPDVLA